MTCERCGSPSNGRLCASCEQMDRVERNHEHQKRSDGGAAAATAPDTQQETPEVPPRPEDVIADERYQYQAMTQLGDEEYAKLAADIRENGVLQPVIVDDSPEQVIIDGHHREAIAKHYDLPEDKQPAYVVVGGRDDDEKLSRAIKQNLIGRDTTDAVKSHAVEQYIELSWDRTDNGDLIRPETDTEVADKLGVNHSLVSRVVRNWSRPIVDHDRVKARRYYEDNRDASYREVARQVDSAKATVTRWLKEDFDERDDDEDDEDDQPTLTATTTDRSEAEKTADVFRRAQEDDDEDVRDEAEANAERLARGETSPDAASKNVEMVEAEKAVEDDREADQDHEPTVVEADARDWLTETAPDAAVMVTDPPFTTDVDDISAFAESWTQKALNAIRSDGYAYIFIGSYADELEAYLSVLSETDWYVQPLVWNYRNTLGRSPSDRYKRDWQAVLYCRGPDAGDLNAPQTSELRSVQEVNAPGMVGDDNERHHRWQKPRSLVEQYIRHGSQQDEIVIDPFAGSGEVLLAAADVGRDAYGCDLDPDAVATAVERGCVQDE